MQSPRTFLLIATLALSLVALAPEPSVATVSTSVSSDGGGLLGQVDAIANFCSVADPSSSAKFWQFRNQMTAGMTTPALTKARNTADYRQVFQSVTSMLNSIPRAQRSSACKFLITGNGGSSV